MKKIIPVLLLLIMAFPTLAQEKISRQEYIDRYKALAVEHMEIYGIPASIKMAQALFESDNGNSRLARQANNHFGIKCKNDWLGATISHTDDAPDECFRKYESTEASFKDHSEFLDGSSRYDALFKLDPTDYKGWAYGLKQAGYATNPNYPQQLIKIIEDNQLYLLDSGQGLNLASLSVVEEEAPIVMVAQIVEQDIPLRSTDVVDVDNYSISMHGNVARRTLYSNNGSQFVTANAGDTYASIAGEFGVSVKKILAYNDNVNRPLSQGEMVYVKQKNKKAQNGKLIHVAKDGETMHSISQAYGIKLNNLCNMNRRTKDSEVRNGQQIRLM